MIEIIKTFFSEKMYLFATGFVLGVGCACVCFPQEQEHKETIYELDGVVNSELDEDVKAFLSEISQKYHLYKVRLTIEEE